MDARILASIIGMTHSPVRHYVVPGLTSQLVGGNGHGVVRLFSSDRDTREWVTPHSHRFDFTCVVLAGSVENILFVRSDNAGEGNLYSIGKTRPMDGAFGTYETKHGEDAVWFEERASTYGVGDTYSMTYSQIHSIRFSRGARVLFLEGPNCSEDSVFLEPFSNGKTVHTFETRVWMFEREDEQR